MGADAEEKQICESKVQAPDWQKLRVDGLSSGGVGYA